MPALKRPAQPFTRRLCLSPDNLGPGNAFAPDFYAIACITFDWLVTLYIVIAYGTGLVGARRTTRRGAARSPVLR